MRIESALMPLWRSTLVMRIKTILIKLSVCTQCQNLTETSPSNNLRGTGSNKSKKNGFSDWILKLNGISNGFSPLKQTHRRTTTMSRPNSNWTTKPYSPTAIVSIRRLRPAALPPAIRLNTPATRAYRVEAPRPPSLRPRWAIRIWATAPFSIRCSLTIRSTRSRPATWPAI